MLSILIPTYNYVLVPLVEALTTQAENLNIIYEIRIYDDASPSKEVKLKNAVLKGKKNIVYQELPKNIGRSAIRNKLAREAQYAYLLFLDSDGMPAHPDFLKKYVNHLSPNHILSGGTIYEAFAPKGKELHWLVGSKREVFPAYIRNKKPYEQFTSNNFAIAKAIFEKYPFEEKIRKYGHEDTLFGLSFRDSDYKILHIDNPVLHQGLDTADIYLQKTRQAIKNLFFVQATYPHFNTTLQKFYHNLKKSQLLYPFLLLYRKNEKRIESNLRSSSPRLFYFQWYKLYWLHQSIREKTI